MHFGSSCCWGALESWPDFILHFIFAVEIVADCMPSALTGLKRTLVSLLLEVARVYGLILGLNRESSDDDDVVRSYRKLSGRNKCFM